MFVIMVEVALCSFDLKFILGQDLVYTLSIPGSLAGDNVAKQSKEQLFSSLFKQLSLLLFQLCKADWF